MFTAAARDNSPGADQPLLSSPPVPLLPLPRCPLLPPACRPVLPNTRLPDGPCPRLPHGPRRLAQGRAGRHQVVDQDDQPFGQEPPATRDDGQRAREIVQPLPGVEPRLVRHAPPLAQYGHHPRRHPRPPQLTRRRQRDPPRRIMPTGPDGPPRGRHGNEQHRHPDPLAHPAATADRPCRRDTAPGPRGTAFGLRRAHLPHGRPHGPRQSRPERPREAQHPPLLVGQQYRPYRIRVPSRRVHHRQSGRLRHRSHPAGRGPGQGGTALRTEHRTRPPAASTLGRQHQIGEVLPPPPHAHHCAQARADRPPLWITTCGKLPPRREQQFARQIPAPYNQ